MLPLRNIGISCAAITIALAFLTRARWLQSIDDEVERVTAPLRDGSLLHRAARVGTLPGEPYMHPTIGALSAVVIIAARDGAVLRALAPLAAASIGAIIAHHAVKFFYRRPRPALALSRGKTEPSYPSGHTTDSTAVLATSAYLLAREGLAPLVIVVVAAAMLAVGTGISRVVLGWHWATDVLGGWLAGIAVACAAAGLYELLLRSS